MKKSLFILASAMLCCSYVTKAQVITTVAGNNVGGYSGDGGAAISAEIDYPCGIFLDSVCNIYIADGYNSRIRKVDKSTGNISTIAGTGSAGFSGDGGLAVNAQINAPNGVTVDASGNVYFADYNNHRVRKISTSGIITTIAGTGTAGFSGDGNLATSANLYLPNQVKFDPNGNLIVIDYANNRVRRIDKTTNFITTIAGNGTSAFSGDGGQATNAGIYKPHDVAFDNLGNMYVVDYINNRIRMVNTSGVISTFAGTGATGYTGDGGLATAATFNTPAGIAIDANNNVYITDFYNNCVRKVNSSTGIITTIAGNGTAGYSGNGGLPTLAELKMPYGVELDAIGNIYVGESGNSVVREIKLSGGPSGNACTPSSSINTFSKQNNLKIYPNPSMGTVTVELANQTTTTSYKIFNILGNEVKTGNLTLLTNKIDLNDLANGMYTIVVSQKEGTTSSKISLQR